MKPGDTSKSSDGGKGAKAADSSKSDGIKFVGGNPKSEPAKPAKAGPDVSEMIARDLPKAAFPGRGAKEFRVFLDATVHAAIARHAGEDTSVEICGVMVGDWQTDDDGPYVSITASIAGEAVANKLSEVTFTHDTWAKIHKRMDAEFADKSIIGWYHTHPNFGIFLSERDCFIHEHFFNGPGQVAYVVDPVRKEEGFFVWNKGKPTPAAVYWVGKDIRLAPPIEDDKREMRERAMGGSSSSRASEGDADGSGRTGGGGGRREPDAAPVLTWVSNGLFGLCLFMLGFMLSKYFSLSERSRVADDLIRYVVAKGIKPGFGPSLAAVNGKLASLSMDSARLAEMSAATQPAVNQNAMWAAMSARLGETVKQMESLRAIYALSPEDEAAITKLLQPEPAGGPAPAAGAAAGAGAAPIPGAPAPAGNPPATQSTAAPAPGTQAPPATNPTAPHIPAIAPGNQLK